MVRAFFSTAVIFAFSLLGLPFSWSEDFENLLSKYEKTYLCSNPSAHSDLAIEVEKIESVFFEAAEHSKENYDKIGKIFSLKVAEALSSEDQKKILPLWDLFEYLQEGWNKRYLYAKTNKQDTRISQGMLAGENLGSILSTPLQSYYISKLALASQNHPELLPKYFRFLRLLQVAPTLGALAGAATGKALNLKEGGLPASPAQLLHLDTQEESLSEKDRALIYKGISSGLALAAGEATLKILKLARAGSTAAKGAQAGGAATGNVFELGISLAAQIVLEDLIEEGLSRSRFNQLKSELLIASRKFNTSADVHNAYELSEKAIRLSTFLNLPIETVELSFLEAVGFDFSKTADLPLQTRKQLTVALRAAQNTLGLASRYEQVPSIEFHDSYEDPDFYHFEAQNLLIEVAQKGEIKNWIEDYDKRIFDAQEWIPANTPSSEIPILLPFRLYHYDHPTKPGQSCAYLKNFVQIDSLRPEPTSPLQYVNHPYARWPLGRRLTMDENLFPSWSKPIRIEGTPLPLRLSHYLDFYLYMLKRYLDDGHVFYDRALMEGDEVFVNSFGGVFLNNYKKADLDFDRAPVSKNNQSLHNPSPFPENADQASLAVLKKLQKMHLEKLSNDLLSGRLTKNPNRVLLQTAALLLQAPQKFVRRKANTVIGVLRHRHYDLGGSSCF